MAQLIVDIITRLGKGSPLTIKEMDTNLTNLKEAIRVLSINIASGVDSGLMSASDKAKLDTVETGANKYIHPLTNGNRHLPNVTPTDIGKVLKASAIDGTGVWSPVSWTDVQSKPTFGSAATFNVAVSGDAGPNQVVLGNDTRLAYIANLANNTIAINNVIGLQTALDNLSNTITSNKTTTDNQLANVNAQLTLLNGLSSQFDVVKSEVDTLETTVVGYNTTINTLTTENDLLDDRVTTLEQDIIDLQNSGGGTGGGSIMYERTTGTSVTVGGLTAGTVLTGTTVQDVFDRILFPYQQPAFTSFTVPSSIQTNALGSTVQGTYTFTWSTSNSANVAVNTVSIMDVTGAKSLVSGTANDGNQSVTIGPITYSTASTHTFRITAIDIKGTTLSRDVIIRWSPTIYYGESALTALTANDVIGLRVSEQTTTASKTYAFLGGGYKWLCYPVSMGLKMTFRDASTNFDVSMNPVTTVNVNGTDFYCHRTYNTLGGSINIVVS